MSEKKQKNVWKPVAIIAICLLLIVSACYGLGIGYEKNVCSLPAKDEPSAASLDKALSLWNDDAAAKKEITEYLKAVTDEKSTDFIPVENRIAVFDLDGTLACETDPVYFDHCIYYYRVMEDPTYKDKASDFEKEVAAEVKQFMDTGVSAPDSMEHHGMGVASAFAGLTPEEFVSYVADYAKNTASPGYNNLTRAEAFYKPMLEVIDLLEQNDFTVYIVSGTDRFIVRGLVEASPLKIPANQIIGSDENMVATDQGDTDGIDYVFDENDQLVMGGEFLIKNLDMNKVTVIQQEIGVQPVLAFGNSGSDFSMAQYVLNDNPYKAKAFMLCCDDTARENGNPEKAAKMVKSCEENGYTAISMKNDWKTIYGDNVTRK
ncbi:MAG: haloacid dehalogenase-like hydrolase [Clostridia bacterium]|nr:haloacid dehalogenase-like hydrolase [Clostridia bacterium]